MFAIGCIQSRNCHTDQCPTGVATQDPIRQRAIVVTDKAQRVYHFHANTLHALAELLGAAGLSSPHQLTPERLMVRQANGQALPLSALVETLSHGQLLQDHLDHSQLPRLFADHWPPAQAQRWQS